jgi:hypothetical protein
MEVAEYQPRNFADRAQLHHAVSIGITTYRLRIHHPWESVIKTDPTRGGCENCRHEQQHGSISKTHINEQCPGEFLQAPQRAPDEFKMHDFLYTRLVE